MKSTRVLVDEARTPLIISGQVERPQEKYMRAAEIAAASDACRGDGQRRR